MQQFVYHAFNSSPQEYVELAQDIIKYLGRLPLAPVTLGSHLQGRSGKEWRYEVQKLRAVLHSYIQKLIKMSFDGLGDDTRECFASCCVLSWVFTPEVQMQLLSQKRLFRSARSFFFLLMHNLVQDMGREIVRMESPLHIVKRSRLFNPQEVRAKRADFISKRCTNH